jgi:hypothetical protein
MDSQRTSALQQRLQARREMFMKENSVGGGVNGTQSPAAAAAPSSFAGGKLAAAGAPMGAPPQPPSTAPRALTSLREEQTGCGTYVC